MKKNVLFIFGFIIFFVLFIIPFSKVYASDDGKLIVKEDGMTFEVDDESVTATLVDVSYDEYVAATHSTIFKTYYVTKGKYWVNRIASNAVKTDQFSSIEIYSNDNKPMTIETNAFPNCTKDVFITSGVSVIERDAFSSYKAKISIDRNNPNYTTDGCFLYSKDGKKLISFLTYNPASGTIYGPNVLVKRFDVNDLSIGFDSITTEICDNAFSSLKELKVLTLSKKITKISDTAFDGIKSQIKLRVYNDSYALEYARSHNIKYEIIDRVPDEFEIDEDGGLRVYTNPTELLEIPEEFNGITVRKIVSVSIKENSYNVENLGISEIKIPNTVTEICGSAFKSIRLKRIELPDSIEKIGADAFNNNQLTEIIIPKNVTELGEGAFAINNLKKVIIKNKNVTIGRYAFNINDEKLCIYGYKDSTAKNYAEQNNIKFKICYEEKFKHEGLTYGTDNNNNVALLDVSTDAIKNGRLKLPRTVDYNEKTYTLTVIDEDAVTNEELYNLIEEIEIPSDVKIIENGAFYVKAKKIKILSNNITINANAFDANALNAVNSTMYGYKGSGVDTYANNKKIAYRPIKRIDDIIFAYNDGDKTADLIRIYVNGADEEGRIFLDEKIDGYTIKSFNSYTVDSKNIKYLEIQCEIDEINDLSFKNVEKNITLGVKKDSICEQFAKDKKIDYCIIGEDKYIIDEDGTLSVYTYKDEVIIPEKVEDITVKNIKLISSIKKNGNIKKIEFPKTVNKILNNSCSTLKLEEVIIPGWKTNIEENTFSYSENNQLTIKGYVGSKVWKYRKLYMDEKITKFESLDDNTGLKWGYENYDFANTSDFFIDGNYDIGKPDSIYYKRLSNNLRTASDEYRNNDKNKKNWNGSCFGQAMTTILFKDKVLDVNNWQLNGNASNQFELVDVRDNDDLKNMINIYHTLQHELKTSKGMNLLNSNDKSLKGVFKTVNDYYKSNSGEFLELERWWTCI